MKRVPVANEVLHICQLITGDRFYLRTDAKKEVWELRYQTMVKIRGEFKKFSVCKNDDGVTQRFDANRVVIFLRRAVPPYKPNKDFSIERYFA